jgi:choline-phosphate cytidylyltransferase
LKHCKWVDDVIIGCPWKTTPEWARSQGIHYIAHDDIPYANGADESNNDVYFDMKKAGMWRTTYRTPGVSTSDVVLRIIKDYDMYVERNLKRDYSP